MPEVNIRDDVRALIAEHISSIEQLEVLLLLRSQPDKQWTADEVSHALSTHPKSAAERLADLDTRGFLKSTRNSAAVFSYAPRTPEMTKAVDGLSDAYRDLRISVINLIFSKPLDRVRVFADAFRLRKKEEE